MWWFKRSLELLSVKREFLLMPLLTFLKSFGIKGSEIGLIVLSWILWESSFSVFSSLLPKANFKKFSVLRFSVPYFSRISFNKFLFLYINLKLSICLCCTCSSLSLWTLFMRVAIWFECFCLSYASSFVNLSYKSSYKPSTSYFSSYWQICLTFSAFTYSLTLR